ncbi:MAG: nucleotide sugar dehydrogenase [candidate division Zixibacteria bacterium]|nr:nucleotide sugar dehydrogenase [candidate division Zixibacteria bacterium]
MNTTKTQESERIKLNQTNLKITVIGTGYVGLVTGAGLAEWGSKVTCVDKDVRKIDLLKRGIMPLYEEGLEDVVGRNVGRSRLSFSTNLAEAVSESDIIYIAVGTPSGKNGEANLTYLHAAMKQVLLSITGYAVIVIKSTVPVGTAAELRRLGRSCGVDDSQFDIVSNPEFLRQGTAVYDCLNPSRVIVGCNSMHALEIMRRIYRPLKERNLPFMETTNETAELIKYAANSFLAVKIAFINEMANLCERLNADVRVLSQALGMDKRIGPSFLNPGPGFGGSCLPKDVSALIHTAKSAKYNWRIGKAVTQSNRNQKKNVVEKARMMLGSLKGKHIAVLGMAFKAGTDDTRESPALYIIKKLRSCGAKVCAYDPAAMESAKRSLRKIVYANSPYEACAGVDLLLVLTEWPEFKKLNFIWIRKLMARPYILDTRNLLDCEVLDHLGFVYAANGCGSIESVVEKIEALEAEAKELRLRPIEHASQSRRAAKSKLAVLPMAAK